MITILRTYMPAPVMRACAKFSHRYERLFSIGEIRENIALQWYFGASLFFFFLVFQGWINDSIPTTQSAALGTTNCWPYFQDCTRLYFLHAMSQDYSASMFYMALYAIMTLIVWCMWKKNWNTAHALLAILFIWEALVVFLFAYSINAPYYYYHLYLTAALLFVPYKEYFLKIIFVFCYFVSATVKLDSTWILGTYFTSLKSGLPLIPKLLTPFFTNLIIFSQIVGCWFLLSTNRFLQRTALVFFTMFHLYSGIFVYYLYPSTALLPLLILFGPLYRQTPTPFAWKAIAGWMIIAFIAGFQMIGFVAGPLEQRILTLEDNRFGMFMFEANHQCIISESVYSSYGSAYSADFTLAPQTPCTTLVCKIESRTLIEGSEHVRQTVWESGASLYRCDPYDWWTTIQETCKLDGVQRVSLQFDQSINGGPFFRIIDETNMCGLTYQPFVHNSWIKIPPAAPIVGYPVQDNYRD